MGRAESEEDSDSGRSGDAQHDGRRRPTSASEGLAPEQPNAVAIEPSFRWSEIKRQGFPAAAVPVHPAGAPARTDLAEIRVAPGQIESHPFVQHRCNPAVAIQANPVRLPPGTVVVNAGKAMVVLTIRAFPIPMPAPTNGAKGPGIGSSSSQ